VRAHEPDVIVVRGSPNQLFAIITLLPLVGKELNFIKKSMVNLFVSKSTD